MSAGNDRGSKTDTLERELLRSAELLDVPTPGGKERARAIALGAGAAGLAAAAGGALAPRAAGWLARKWLIALLLGVTVGGGALALWAMLRRDEAPVATVGPTGAIVAPASSAVAEAPAAEPGPAPSSAAQPPASTAQSPASAAPASARSASARSNLALQIAALDQVRALVEAGRGDDALHALDDFDRTYPGSVLTQEAAVTRIQALLVAGRRADADAAGQRFLASHPDSSHAERVRALLRKGAASP